MASIDYQGAKTEIEAIFAKADTQRKIIFWYDAPRNFKEDIENDTFSNCKVLICNQNEFEIKKTIEHDDTTSNFLVYVPSERPADTENWLLDILMYGEEYYADTVALTMRRLGITNTDLRKVIENHVKFFDSEARTKKLNNYVAVNNDTTSNELRVAMMAVLTKAQANNIEGFGVDMYGCATLANDQGQIAQVAFGMDNDYRCEIEIWGSKGTITSGRILTAPAGFTPSYIIKRNQDIETRPLAADDAFLKSIERFIACVEDNSTRTEEYNLMLKQEQLVNEFIQNINK